MPRPLGQEPAQPVAAGVTDFAAEVARRHLVRLVADHQVVGAVRRPQTRLHLLVARQHVEAGDPVARFQEPVPRRRGVPGVAGEDREVESEALGEFLLPLLHQTAGADDEAPPGVAAREEFLDEQPGHDRLAGAGIVGEQETQRLAREHRLIDRGDLVRQRVHLRGLHRQERVEEVRQRDALRFGGQLEEVAVGVETPGPFRLGAFEPFFVFPEEQSVPDDAFRVAEDEGDRLRSVPLDADDGDRAAAGRDSPDPDARRQVVEFHRAPESNSTGRGGLAVTVRSVPTPRRARNRSSTGNAAPGLTRSRTRGCGTSGCGCSR